MGSMMASSTPGSCLAMLPGSKRLLLGLDLQGHHELNLPWIRAAWMCQPKVETTCSWKDASLGECLPGMKSLGGNPSLGLRWFSWD